MSGNRAKFLLFSMFKPLRSLTTALTPGIEALSALSPEGVAIGEALKH